VFGQPLHPPVCVKEAYVRLGTNGEIQNGLDEEADPYSADWRITSQLYAFTYATAYRGAEAPRPVSEPS